MPQTNEELRALTQNDLKFLYYFLSNNLGQIASHMNNTQKGEFWKYYQMVEGLYSQVLFIGLLPDDAIKNISGQIKNAKSAAEKMLLNMQGIVANLNAFKAAIDVIQSAKTLVSG